MSKRFDGPRGKQTGGMPAENNSGCLCSTWRASLRETALIIHAGPSASKITMKRSNVRSTLVFACHLMLRRHACVQRCGFRSRRSSVWILFLRGFCGLLRNHALFQKRAARQRKNLLPEVNFRRAESHVYYLGRTPPRAAIAESGVRNTPACARRVWIARRLRATDQQVPEARIHCGSNEMHPGGS